MKPEQLYQLLKELAEKFEITVSEQNFGKSGVRIRSGLCRVNTKRVFVMDKNQSLKKRIDLLAECLSKLPNEDLYIIPRLRELLNSKKKKVL